MDFLWTDYCFLGLLIAIFLWLMFSLRKSHAQEIFKRLLQRPSAIISGIILLFFLLIGILDSIHMNAVNHARNGDVTISHITSVLDNILAPLGQSYEKTYSAPLALTLFNKEIIVVDGHAQQVYPQLQFIRKTITNSTDKWHRIGIDMLFSLLESVAVTVFIWLITSVFLRCWVPKKNRLLALLCVLSCIFLLMLAYHLSRNFHLFGTGKIGQDIFYYAIKSIRTGLIIGTLTTLFMMPLAIITGLAAGYFGGLVDDVIQYIYTTLSSIPSVLLITASVLSMQTWIANHPQQFASLDDNADARLLALCVILGVTSWTSLCRLLRAEVMKLREMDFILAARALGSSSLRIFYKHLLPNVMPIIIITLVLDFSFLVMAEAVLSYVGVGVSPMTISWGNMINGARLELAREPLVWWPMASAFIFMFTLVLASNLFADAVRDALDPRQAH